MEIQELKSHLSILDIASRLGIAVNKQGRAHCPFHEDKTPSLQFSKEKNICTCFSSNCDAGTMDSIRLTAKKLGMSTHEAIMQLKEWTGNSSQVKSQAGEQLGKRALLAKAFSYFESSLRVTAKAKSYLESRGLQQAGPGTTGIEAGYQSGSFHQKANKYLLEAALQAGLIYEGKTGYSAFARDSLVFPLKNREGQISGLYFRLLEEKQAQKHYYLKDREGLYPHYPTTETKQLILTEAIIDAASLLLLPEILKNYQVLACYGTNGLTAEHLQALQGLEQLEEVIFFFDGDEAGREGSRKGAEKLLELVPGLKVSLVKVPEGEDINSLYVNHPEKASELLIHLLQQREAFLPSLETTKANGTAIPPVLVAAASSSPAITSDEEEKQALDTSDPQRVSYQTTTARYQVLGGLRQELDSLKVSLLIEARNHQGLQRYRNKADLYEYRQVEKLAREAAEKLGLRPDLVELDLSRLTDLLESYRDTLKTPTQPQRSSQLPDPVMQQRCKAFLSQPGLLERLNLLIGEAGVTGEETARIFLFVIAASYKMPDTLHALIQGSSGSGKTHLLAKISSFIPVEDRKSFTRVTESSFYNYGPYELSQKLICLEDLDGMKEEAQLAFRELQSRGMLSSSTTGQDEKGNLRAMERTVYGPIASLACTTKGEIYEDNMSRCFLIAVDESPEQTLKIISYQNRKAAGLIDSRKEKEAALFLESCLRMLKPYTVVNPYAARVQLPEEAHKIRRLNDLYQSFVKQVVLLNQYQRRQDKEGRLVAQREDLEAAAAIMFDSILLKVDELDGSLRQFYEQLKSYVKQQGGINYLQYSFSQREVRQALKVSKTQLQRYLYDLTGLEYIQLSGGYANRGYQYKILYWDNISALKARVKQHLEAQLHHLQ